MRRWAVSLATITYLIACAGCKSGPTRDVVLITVDTLRADHMGLYGYDRPTTPRLDAWFAEDRARIFDRSYSTSASTSPSIVSILSGRYPPTHGVRLFYQLLGDDVRLLPELLPERYVSGAVVSNVVLTDEAIGMASRFDHYDDFVDERESNRKFVYERGAERTTDAALAWLRAAPRDRPLFLWAHYIDPHGPYRAPENRPVRFTHDVPIPIRAGRVPAYQREPGVTDGATYVDRYDEEIAYTDLHVGRLLEGFSTMRSVDDALLIFTADHGETMMDHDRWFTHGYFVYEQIVRVPLMIRGRGMAVGRSAAVVSGIDIVPTILRFVRSERHEALVGLDLAGHAAAEPRVVWSEAGGGQSHRAGISRDGKWIVTTDAAGTVRDRLYFDLANDPEERTRAAWAEAPAYGRAWLTDAIAADPHPGGIPAEYVEGRQLTAPKVAPRVGEADRERLRALGYVD